MCESADRDALVSDVVLKYMTELTDRHPGVTVEVMGKQPWSTADSWLRIIYPSDEASAEVLETQAQLSTKYALNDKICVVGLGEMSEEVCLFVEEPL